MKDPAFLFYPGDWIIGTLGMTFAEKGAYMELLMMQFNRGAFTEKQAIHCLKDVDLWNGIKFKFKKKKDLYWNERLKQEKEKRIAYTESRRKSRLKSDEDNVRIYIVRDNVRLTYKIGSSVNPIRRYNELNNQKSPAIMGDNNPDERDITLIWYSEPVLRIEESRLHEQYDEFKITGEWFKLKQKHLDNIFTVYNGTFVERTSERTENININKDENETGYEILFKSVSEFKGKYSTDILNEFFAYWSEPGKSGKLRWEYEKTWDTKRRLLRWVNNSKKPPEKSKYFTPKEPLIKGQEQIGKIE